MKKLSTNQIRKMWIDFFVSKNHHFLQPVSLVPVEDPSLLWINSGVATLKPYFDGRKTPPSQRLVNSQKSIRTNDIENVGVTARHQTLFEMLGNFSIGEYFKEQAIKFAWELLTDPQWFDIPKEKLYITVFEEDVEAYDIWTQMIKIPEDHIFKMPRETNFWDVGAGPCGPNSEIFFDRGIKWDSENIGPRLLSDDIENDRYIEIWNLVFSQFNNDGNNNFLELPRKNIDTGAGLERIASIFQEVPTNFETDLFMPTIKKVEEMTNNKYHYSIENYDHPTIEQTKVNTAFKVIADHVRAVSFAIADGVFPGNKDRGYIIRRLIRRSSVYGRKLGIETAFLFKLVDQVIQAMGEFYPLLNEKKTIIEQAIQSEEEKFLKTLSKGFEILNKIIKEDKYVSGKNALLLFESYGFPIEQTLEIATEAQVEVNLDEFHQLFNKTKELARNARKDEQAWNKQSEIFAKLSVDSEFIGWDATQISDVKVVFLFTNEQALTSATDQEVFVVLSQTPFYAEKGGQAADNGTIFNENFTGTVLDCQQGPNKQNIHRVLINGTININDVVTANVEEEKRSYTMKNHSGTHLVHAALRQVLGNSVTQSGSYNDEFGLRMDFTFNRNIVETELNQVQIIVNQIINDKIAGQIHFCSIQEATSKYHALAFFAEKYDEIVRVVQFGDFSSELCGGTHVSNTQEVEQFLITSIESKGSGTFRIKCLTSNKTISEYLNHEFEQATQELENLFSKYNMNKELISDLELENKHQAIKILTSTKENLQKLKTLLVEYKDLNKNFTKRLEELEINNKITKYFDLTPLENTIKAELNDLSMKELKSLSDELKNKHQDIIIILYNLHEKSIIVSVSENISNEHKAIEIFKAITDFKVKGGGNNTFAQGKIVE